MSMAENMKPVTVFMDDKARSSVKVLATISGKTEAQIRREAISEGLQVLRERYKGKSKGLLSLSGMITEGSNVPTDMAENHNEYAWDK
jgi:hypothetical protein